MKNGPKFEIHVLQHEKSDANASTTKLPSVLTGYPTPNLVARSCAINNYLQHKVMVSDFLHCCCTTRS